MADSLSQEEGEGDVTDIDPTAAAQLPRGCSTASSAVLGLAVGWREGEGVQYVSLQELVVQHGQGVVLPSTQTLLYLNVPHQRPQENGHHESLQSAPSQQNHLQHPRHQMFTPSPPSSPSPQQGASSRGAAVLRSLRDDGGGDGVDSFSSDFGRDRLVEDSEEPPGRGP